MEKKIWLTDKRTKVFVIITLSSVLIVCLLLIKWRQNVPTINERWTAHSSKAFIEFAKKADQMWREGRSLEQKSEAQKLCLKQWEGKNYDESFLQCNPEYFSCLMGEMASFELNKVKIKKSKKDFKMLANKDLLNSEGGVEYLFIFDVEYEGQKIERPLYLLDTCKETYLPQRLYGMNSREQAKVWEWDNFNRHFFIDRHQVTIAEVKRWKKYFNKNIKIPKGDDFQAATFLTKNQMHEYCFDYGKEVLTSMVYDAAVFHPGDYDNPRSPFLNRSRFPWSRSNIQSFIFKKWKNRSKLMNKEECQKVYSKECSAVTPYKHHSTLSNSWTGIYDVMGGVFEYVNNTIDPKKNLILSSQFFSILSRVHEVGIRGYWTGDFFDFSQFDFGKYREDIEDQNDLPVAFRCMRRVHE